MFAMSPAERVGIIPERAGVGEVGRRAGPKSSGIEDGRACGNDSGRVDDRKNFSVGSRTAREQQRLGRVVARRVGKVCPWRRVPLRTVIDTKSGLVDQVCRDRRCAVYSQHFGPPPNCSVETTLPGCGGSDAIDSFIGPLKTDAVILIDIVIEFEIALLPVVVVIVALDDSN